MKTFRWDILSRVEPEDQAEIVQVLLTNRQVNSKQDRDEFFSPTDPLELTPSSVGISAIQLRQATKRLVKAIKEKEKIVVYGDYDADGICATAIVWETLHHLGAAAMPYIPDRLTEGYGPR